MEKGEHFFISEGHTNVYFLYDKNIFVEPQRGTMNKNGW